MDIGTFIRSIPKAELHLHIEGTLEPELKFALAARNRLELPYASADEMRAAYDFDDLSSFLAQYYEGMSVLLTAADFHDLAMAYYERVAAQGLVYVEMFFDPQAHTSRGVSFETVVSGLRQAQEEAARAVRHPLPADHVLPARPLGRVGLRDARVRPRRIATGSSAWGWTRTSATTHRASSVRSSRLHASRAIG